MMGEDRGSSNNNDDEKVEVNIYPLNSYYFGSKDSIPFKDHSLHHRLQRIKSKFVYFSFYYAFLYSIYISLSLFYWTMFLFCCCDCECFIIALMHVECELVWKLLWWLVLYHFPLEQVVLLLLKNWNKLQIW
jgi:hypothetical protein